MKKVEDVNDTSLQNSQVTPKVLIYMLSKGLLVTNAWTIMKDRSTSGRMSISLEEDCPWQMQKQTTVAISSTEAEILALQVACAQNPVFPPKTKHNQIRPSLQFEMLGANAINVGNLAQLTFSKPLFSPQWKYLVHVLLHCLSPKSTSWEQFGTNIASALVGLATNQNSTFLLMIMNGMSRTFSNGVTPFLMTQGTPTQVLLIPRTASEQGTASFHEHNVQEEDTAHPYSLIYDDKGAAVTPRRDLERKSDETEEVNIEEKEASNVKSGDTEELDLEITQTLGTTNDERLLGKIQAEWDAEEEVKSLKK
ncbi:hypothetical protein Tco_0565288 [Tanacetum coccineum]